MLERTYRQSYSFDARNSSLTKVRGTPEVVTFAVTAHYSLSRISVPPANPSPGAPPPTEPPSTLPDIRSLFLGFHYSLAKLPDEPMRPRVLDERIGYFWTERFDYTTDTPRLPIVSYVNRWRLEKKDPTAALSEPKQPIVFWLERTIPERYRPAIRDGILEWNKAFERIGFKDAVKVEIQPDDADWDAGDVHHASVRWMTTARPSFGAIGPSTVDPRTGEILDADIGIRREHRPQRPSLPRRADLGRLRGSCHSVQRHASASTRMAPRRKPASRWIFSRPAARSSPTGADAEAFVYAYVKDVMMHEVGHTLGLTHNFRASTVYTQRAARGRGIHRSQRHRRLGDGVQPVQHRARRSSARAPTTCRRSGRTTTGRSSTGTRRSPPNAKMRSSRRSRSRSNEPQLAFTMDDTIFASGLDPDVNMFDLGDDPLAYATNRLTLVRELWARTERMPLKVDEQYAILRRNLSRGLSEASISVQHAAKFVGGVTTAARPRRQRPHTAQSGGGGEAARGAQDARDRGLLRRQLPLPAGLPAPRVDQLFRHREQPRGRVARATA